MTIHYSRKAAEQIAGAGNIYGSTVAACGAYLKNYGIAAILTADEDAVTSRSSSRRSRPDDEP